MVHLGRRRAAFLIVAAVAIAGVIVVRATQPASGHWLDQGQRIVDGVVTLGERSCTNVGTTDIDCDAIIEPALAAAATREPAGHVASVTLAELPRIWQAANGESLFSHGTPRSVGSLVVVLVTFTDGHRRAAGLRCIGPESPSPTGSPTADSCLVDDTVLATYTAG
jgi:hypothetical protein